MPHAQMYMFGSIIVSLTRLTSADTYLTVTPLFHGNAQFMAAYPALIAGRPGGRSGPGSAPAGGPTSCARTRSP